jgi:hypothetical protein
MMSQYGAYALYAGLVRLRALRRMHMPTHARKHLHRPICNTCCFSSATMIIGTRLVCLVSLLLYGCSPPLISNQTFEQCCHFCLYSDCWSQQKSILASIVPRRAIKDGVEPFVGSISTVYFEELAAIYGSCRRLRSLLFIFPPDGLKLWDIQALCFCQLQK